MKVIFALAVFVVACNGEDASARKYPYFALVEANSQPNCAGVILTEELVMVPAHCVATIGSPTEFTVTVGEVDKKDMAKAYKVKKALVSKYFNFESRTDDIGFLVMSSKIEFNANVKPLEKIHKYVEKENQVFTLFGLTTQNELKSFEENTFVTWMCQEYLNVRDVEFSDTSICITQNHRGNIGIDSFILVTKNGELVGLVNYISDIEDGTNVFTAVQNYEQLINEVKNKNYENVV